MESICSSGDSCGGPEQIDPSFILNPLIIKLFCTWAFLPPSAASQMIPKRIQLQRTSLFTVFSSVFTPEKKNATIFKSLAWKYGKESGGEKSVVGFTEMFFNLSHIRPHARPPSLTRTRFPCFRAQIHRSALGFSSSRASHAANAHTLPNVDLCWRASRRVLITHTHAHL